MEKIYKQIIKGIFLDRPNRFICHALVDGRKVICHMPNPGRMREFLYPGVTLFLTPNRPGLRTAFRAVGVEKGEQKDIFYLDTTRANDVAAYLVQHRRIPGWEHCFLAAREVTMGDSRFDLLLCDEITGETFPVEVKSCSFSGEKGAMFPDAPTLRGSKHLAHLIGMSEKGERAGLLILVHYSKAEWFLPNFHGDPSFAAYFRKGMDSLEWKTVVLSWTPDFVMPESVRLIGSSARALDDEMGNHGDYMIVLYVSEDRDVETGSLGIIHYPQGYYVYVGSAKKNLEQRIAQHRAVRKRKHWHLDYLREKSSFIGAVPIRTAEDLECRLAQRISMIADWKIERFGSSDCRCESHLFGFRENPLHLPSFLKVEEDFEINRLQKYFS